METKVVKIDRCRPEAALLAEAGELLRAGQLVAFPTETVYGLGGDALDETAAARIYAAKGRPSDNPLIVHIGHKSQLYELAAEVPQQAVALADAFWPGPLTIILKKSGLVPKATTGGLDTVAIRMPSHPVALSLLQQSGIMIAAPSANASGRPSPTQAAHVYEDLNGRIPMLLDGGPVEIGLESTIVDLSGAQPCILRPGYITIGMLQTILPDVCYDPALLQRKKQENIVAKAPGMKYRHYAPKGQLVIYEGREQAVVERILQEAAAKKAEGFSVAVLACDETKDRYAEYLVRSVGARKREAEIAANLFATLREFDRLGAEYIFGECFFHDGLGDAIMNRLMKAAGYQLVEVD